MTMDSAISSSRRCIADARGFLPASLYVALVLISLIAPSSIARAIPVSLNFGLRVDYIDPQQVSADAFHRALRDTEVGDVGTMVFAFDTDDMVSSSPLSFEFAGGMSNLMTFDGVSQSDSSADGDPWILTLGDGAVDSISIGYYEYESGIGAGFRLLDPTGTAFDLSGLSDPLDIFLTLDARSFTDGSWYTDSECCIAHAGSIFPIPEPGTGCLVGLALGWLAFREREWGAVP